MTILGVMISFALFCFISFSVSHINDKPDKEYSNAYEVVTYDIHANNDQILIKEIEKKD